MVMSAGGTGSVNSEGFDVVDGGGGEALRADGQLYGYGCGTVFSDPFVPDTIGSMNFLPACIAHDACYTTAAQPRNACDAALGSAVQEACEDAGYPYLVCIIIGITYRSGVALLGAGAYNAASEASEASGVAAPVAELYLY